jgi:hypothetical protein
MRDSFEIWQLKDTPDTRQLRFMNSEFLARHDLMVDLDNYARVYDSDLKPGTTLEDLYTQFNLNHPEDYRGHSMSVSDLVILNQGGETAAFFCDSIGFTDVSDFVVQDYEKVREKPSIRQRLKEAREKQKEQPLQQREKVSTKSQETSL